MLVCHCHAITDREIREEVSLGARTIDDVMRACRAATKCGGCTPLVVETVLDELERDHQLAARGETPVRLRLRVPA